MCTFHRRGGRFRICRHRAGGPRLLRIALCVAPTKLVSMARPATPEAPIWVLAFNSGSPSGFALSATRRILNGIWKISEAQPVNLMSWQCLLLAQSGHGPLPVLSLNPIRWLVLTLGAA